MKGLKDCWLIVDSARQGSLKKTLCAFYDLMTSYDSLACELNERIEMKILRVHSTAPITNSMVSNRS